MPEVQGCTLSAQPAAVMESADSTFECLQHCSTVSSRRTVCFCKAFVRVARSLHHGAAAVAAQLLVDLRVREHATRVHKCASLATHAALSVAHIMFIYRNNQVLKLRCEHQIGFRFVCMLSTRAYEVRSS